MRHLDRLLEAVSLIAVTMLGMWALYYWVLVLGFASSFNTLISLLPVYFVLTALASWLIVRSTLRTSSDVQQASFSQKVVLPGSGAFENLGKRWPLLVALGGIGISTLVYLMDWMSGTLVYGFCWSLLVPMALFFWGRSTGLSHNSSSDCSYNSVPTWDSLLTIFLVIGLAAMFFGSGSFSADDAYYVHVMATTLANPDLSVLHRDSMLATGAPYLLHPAYITTAYEVLIAVLAKLGGVDPIHIYLNVMPAFGAVLLVLCSWLFMRTLQLPWPGVAVAFCVVALLFWSAPKAPASTMATLFVGKALSAHISAPLLFALVWRYVRRSSFTSFLILLLGVAAVASLSTTALFVAPLCLALAAIIIMPASIQSAVKLAAVMASAALPVALVLIYSLLVLSNYPVNIDSGTGRLLPSSVALGGTGAHILLLISLLLLPFISKALAPAQQRLLVRLCFLGALSLYLPFILEFLAGLSGMYLLSWRLHWAFPSTMLPGIIVSLALIYALHHNDGDESGYGLRKFLALGLPVVWIAVFSLSFQGSVMHAFSPSAKALSEMKLAEAKQIRELLPSKQLKRTLVATAHLDDVLPALPEPLQFIRVRHYLDYHKSFIGEEEFERRNKLYDALRVLPNSKDHSMKEIITLADALDVSSLVFAAQKANEGSALTSASARLTQALSKNSYQCTTTSSGISVVCNRHY